MILGSYGMPLDKFNTDHQVMYAPMSPRISFSNDFVDTQQMIKLERSSREAPASSDFEFSVTNNPMMTADELFSKGRLLPFKDSCTNQLQKMTLRDELLMDDDHGNVLPPKPPKGSIKWKELLGLKRPQILSKKAEKMDGSMKRVVEGKGSMLGLEESHVSKTSQVRKETER